MSIKVGVLGAAGRMGATVCHAVHADAELELVAAVDSSRVGSSLVDVGGPDVDLDVAGEVGAMKAAGAEVVVDFTIAAAASQNLPVVPTTAWMPSAASYVWWRKSP